MATNYRSQPIKYQRDESQLDGELMSQVLQLKDQKYDMAEARINASMAQLGNFSIDHKETKGRFSQEMNKMLQTLSKSNLRDLSNKNVERAINKHIGSLLTPEYLQHNAISKAKQDFESQMETLAQEEPEKYNQDNYYFAKVESGYYDYLESGRLGDFKRSELRYSENVSVDNEIYDKLEQIKKLRGSRTVETIDPETNSIVSIKMDGMSKEYLTAIIPTLLESRHTRQLTINGSANYNFNDDIARASLEEALIAEKENYEAARQKVKKDLAIQKNILGEEDYKNREKVYDLYLKNLKVGIDNLESNKGNVTAKSLGKMVAERELVRNLTAQIATEPSELVKNISTSTTNTKKSNEAFIKTLEKKQGDLAKSITPAGIDTKLIGKNLNKGRHTVDSFTDEVKSSKEGYLTALQGLVSEIEDSLDPSESLEESFTVYQEGQGEGEMGSEQHMEWYRTVMAEKLDKNKATFVGKSYEVTKLRAQAKQMESIEDDVNRFASGVALSQGLKDVKALRDNPSDDSVLVYTLDTNTGRVITQAMSDYTQDWTEDEIKEALMDPSSELRRSVDFHANPDRFNNLSNGFKPGISQEALLRNVEEILEIGEELGYRKEDVLEGIELKTVTGKGGFSFEEKEMSLEEKVSFLEGTYTPPEGRTIIPVMRTQGKVKPLENLESILVNKSGTPAGEVIKTIYLASTYTEYDRHKPAQKIKRYSEKVFEEGLIPAENIGRIREVEHNRSKALIGGQYFNAYSDKKLNEVKQEAILNHTAIAGNHKATLTTGARGTTTYNMMNHVVANLDSTTETAFSVDNTNPVEVMYSPADDSFVFSQVSTKREEAPAQTTLPRATVDSTIYSYEEGNEDMRELVEQTRGKFISTFDNLVRPYGEGGIQRFNTIEDEVINIKFLGDKADDVRYSAQLINDNEHLRGVIEASTKTGAQLDLLNTFGDIPEVGNYIVENMDSILDFNKGRVKLKFDSVKKRSGEGYNTNITLLNSEGEEFHTLTFGGAGSITGITGYEALHEVAHKVPEYYILEMIKSKIMDIVIDNTDITNRLEKEISEFFKGSAE